MGQSFARFGCEVTIVQRGSQLLAREDPDVVRPLQEQLKSEGVELLLETTALAVESGADGKRVRVKTGGEERTLICDEVLVAVGRAPSIAPLNLESAGIATNRRGIIVNEKLETSQPHVYAVGDCNGGPQFTHWAEYEARVATRNALFKGSEKRQSNRIPWVTFTDPEVARCGLTLAEPFTKVDRAVCEGRAQGLLRVVVDGKGRILGVHISGPHAGESLTEWVLAMDHGITLEQLGQSIHAYPTFSRVNRRVADQRFLEEGVSTWKTRLFANFTPRKS
jgi:pyruvate/2-oxoglutarate dehydrogenase complex dihydrolipoamide dehydrogenase (E3) component